MNNKKLSATKLVIITVCVFAVGCNTPKEEKSSASATETTATAKPDLAGIKAEIQALENEWAAADNARDAKAIVAFYSDDAVTFSNNKPMISGKDDILKDIEASMAKRTKGSTISFEVMDIFACDNTATETGKTTSKDSSGKVAYTGKYMAIWEKRDGKYLCIRDISNNDVIEK